VSSKERGKEIQIPGKGHNETLEIVNPLKHMTAATDAVDGHVPKNGGTCEMSGALRNLI
jgi:hypothetical protein